MTNPEDVTTIDADLRALDEALAAGTVTATDPVERELQELALALRADAPAPSPEFGAELRARVDDGFPRERRRLPRPSLRLPKLRRPSLPVLGGVASVLVVAVVAVSLIDDDDRVVNTLSGGSRLSSDSTPSTQNKGSRAEALGAAEDQSAAGAGARDSAPQGDIAVLPAPAPNVIAPEPPAAGGGFAPGERKRRIERFAALTLAAPVDRLDRVADGIVRLTDRYQGFVLRSSLTTGDDGTTGGEFELRIPADRVQPALTGLSRLADVRARTQSGQDVTTEFVSAEERLEGARAERRSLLRRLERAPTDAAAESIRRRLDLNAGEVRGLRRQVRDLRTRTNYASVSVTLVEKDGDDGASSRGGDGLGGALDDALASLSDSVEVGIRALGVLLPLALLAGCVALGARAVRQRRREAALG